MWIKSIYGKSDEFISKINKLINEKEFLLEITVGPIREQLMQEIVLLRDTSELLRELSIMSKSYEDLLEIKWRYDSPSNMEIIMGKDK